MTGIETPDFKIETKEDSSCVVSFKDKGKSLYVRSIKTSPVFHPMPDAVSIVVSFDIVFDEARITAEEVLWLSNFRSKASSSMGGTPISRYSEPLHLSHPKRDVSESRRYSEKIIFSSAIFDLIIPPTIFFSGRTFEKPPESVMSDGNWDSFSPESSATSLVLALREIGMRSHPSKRYGSPFDSFPKPSFGGSKIDKKLSIEDKWKEVFDGPTVAVDDVSIERVRAIRERHLSGMSGIFIDDEVPEAPTKTFDSGVSPQAARQMIATLAKLASDTPEQFARILSQELESRPQFVTALKRIVLEKEAAEEVQDNPVIEEGTEEASFEEEMELLSGAKVEKERRW